MCSMFSSFVMSRRGAVAASIITHMMVPYSQYTYSIVYVYVYIYICTYIVCIHCKIPQDDVRTVLI